MTWFEGAKWRQRFIEVGRAAWDSPDSQPVDHLTWATYMDVYKQVAFEDNPRALALLERVPYLLELWGTDDVSAEEWDEVKQWLADLKKMEEETDG